MTDSLYGLAKLDSHMYSQIVLEKSDNYILSTFEKNISMKRITALFIFIISTMYVTAQWNQEPNIENKCSHAKISRDKMVFNPDYNWQSQYLFDYDVTSYIIDLEVSDTTTYVEGNATINCIALVPVDTFAFELIPEQNIDQILFNGIEYTNYYRDGDNVLVPVVEVPQGSSISTQIYYHGKPPTGNFFSGITNDSSNYWHKSVTWTLCQ